ncbi:MAG: hypothetical protein AAFR64_02035 [Pseudomonadota bacterium]
MLSHSRNPASWQLILADLSLILFLVTSAALTQSGSKSDTSDQAAGQPNAPAQMASAQALYRGRPGLLSFGEWLGEQPLDPRASLTIVAQHRAGRQDKAWSQARSMAATASALGVRSRVIIREGETYDVYASLAFDQPNE